ncbi:ParB/RepB/Spo0J family partition protein [Longimicrobium sp.]|uniref:ParB/RepB/Spo0J family partition protein n=1 Tax=Longimicrobium sp. TaxID=2029185 RepID=UPI002C904F78|nr:ParB/RepB/Spo0J family partition protein [Longimicrobium sp.]HSU16030.1 ParB/RepB/Spo0J family partition protein [Longimicrobium sp.]
MATRKPRLGKGLSALLGDFSAETQQAIETGDGVREVPTSRIAPNPFQPRREFSAEQLAELEESIRKNGLLQPLVVRPRTATTPEGAEWELIAGERRWRAVRRLGWSQVPVVVRDIDDRAMLVLAIVENVQRAGLSALEEAAGYKQLIDEFGYTQAEVADSVGRERSTVANLLRLLALPASVQRMVNEGDLSMGHARALLGLEDEREMADLARQAVDAGMSVRTIEERVRQLRPGGSGAPSPRSTMAGLRDAMDDPHVRHLEAELQRALGTAARIRVTSGKAGRIEIPFYNADDFDRVVELLLGSEAERA